MKPYFELLQLLKPFRLKVYLAIVLIFIHTALTIYLVSIASQLGQLLKQFDFVLFSYLLVQIMILFLCKSLIQYVHTLLLSMVAFAAVKELRLNYFKRLLKQSFEQLEKHSHGELLTVFNDDIDKVRLAFQKALADFLPACIICFSLIIVLFYMNWLLSLVALVVIPLVSVFIQWFSQKIMKHTHKVQKGLSQIQQDLQDYFQNFMTIKLFQSESFASLRLSQFEQDYFNQRIKNLTFLAAQSPLFGFFQACAIVGLIIIGAWQVDSGYIEMAQLLAFASAVALTIDPLLLVTNSLGDLQVGSVSLVRVRDLCSKASAISMPEVNLKASFAIKTHHLSFKYEPSIDGTLTHINLEIEKGQKVGVVGATGSGKSTLFYLLAGLYTPLSGEVFWGYQRVHFIPQDPPVLNMSLKDNLLLGESYSSIDIHQVLEVCQLLSMIEQLPEGLESPAGSQGQCLSGGQKQRLAIARALLRKPDILLLDEATSDIDADTEQRLFESLFDYLPHLTLLMTTHRKESLRYVTHVFLIKDGQILKEGNHEEILHSSHYSELFRMGES